MSNKKSTSKKNGYVHINNNNELEALMSAFCYLYKTTDGNKDQEYNNALMPTLNSLWSLIQKIKKEKASKKI